MKNILERIPSNLPHASVGVICWSCYTESCVKVMIHDMLVPMLLLGYIWVQCLLSYGTFNMLSHSICLKFSLKVFTAKLFYYVYGRACQNMHNTNAFTVNKNSGFKLWMRRSLKIYIWMLTNKIFEASVFATQVRIHT